MATYNDFEGVWATVQSIFLHNDWDSPDDVELVIVDTSPRGEEHQRLVTDFLAKGGNLIKGCRTPNIKLVQGPPGTTEARDMVFRLSTAPYTVVMDCHVMLHSNSLLRLLNWFEANPNTPDLIHGPLLYDNLHGIATEFDDQFRGGMWGTWGNQWIVNDIPFLCINQEISDTPSDREDIGTVLTVDPFSLEVVDVGLPLIDWAGHEKVLLNYGCIELGRCDSDIPFEIPACGMGFFAACTKEWLGFAKNCSGFGGEELNIHTKYRQANRKVLCLPFLKWNHRWGRAGGNPYPAPLAAKVRNYVLWCNELGNPVLRGKHLLDRIHTHFAHSFTQEKWDKLIADPVNYPINFDRPKRVGNDQHPVDFMFLQYGMTSPDLKEYAEIVRSYASKVNSIRAFVKRAAWEPVLADGFPTTLEIFQAESSLITKQTHEAVSQNSVKDHRKIVNYSTHHVDVDPLLVEPADFDLLVIDKENSAEYISAVLKRHAEATKVAIFIRGSHQFGEVKENGDGPGIWYAFKDFLAANPNWFIQSHYNHHYGATILARDPVTRPVEPITPWPKGYGPGTELKSILGSIGINPGPTCDCNRKMREMDDWGITGCEEHLDEIVEHIKKKAEAWGWNLDISKKVEIDESIKKFSFSEKLSIGWKSITTGLVFQINWLDPFPGLIQEAIKRAKDKES